jgi:hypothetical protein
MGTSEVVRRRNSVLGFFAPSAVVAAENLLLRRQLIVFRRSSLRPRLPRRRRYRLLAWRRGGTAANPGAIACLQFNGPSRVNNSLERTSLRTSTSQQIVYAADVRPISPGRTEERVQILAKIGRPKLCEPKFSASLCGTNK